MGPRLDLTRRRFLGAAGTAGLAAAAGCQSQGDAEQSVTPAAVPDEEGKRGTLVVRYDAAGESGPATSAMQDLITSFMEARSGVRVVTQQPSEAPPESGRSVVSFGRLGAAVADRADRGELSSVETVWDPVSSRIPNGLVQTCYLSRELVAVPQTVHWLNCLYYNPTVLESADSDRETYATVSQLAAEPGSLTGAVDALFATPFGSPRDRVALWESVLSSRLVSQRQFDQIRSWRADTNRLTLRRAMRDYAAALSLLPADAAGVAPTTLLDRVVDGRLGFARLSSRAVPYLLDRSDAVYGTDWEIAPMFSSPWAVVADVEGFVVSVASADLALPLSFLQFATEPDTQRQFNATRGAVPARTDAANAVDDHPVYRTAAAHYQDATIHAPSFADGLVVREDVRRQIAAELSELETHGSIERTTDGLLSVLENVSML